MKENERKMKMVVKGISRKIFRRIALESCPTVHLRGDPMIPDHWFQQVEKILEAMEIISNATKIKLAAFQLEGESQI